jgi:hypothetical protein
MSRDYYMVCCVCKVYLYCGRNGRLFMGTGSNVELLEAFLFQHVDHEMCFADEETVPELIGVHD